MNPSIFAFAGPSGVGKNVIIKTLLELEPAILYIPSYTTRPMRPGEIDGFSYNFVSVERFFELHQQGFLLEIEENYGNWYGVPRKLYRDTIDSGKSIVKDIYIRGAFALKQEFKDQCGMIFITVPDISYVESRLDGRGSETPEDKSKRLKGFNYENSFKHQFDIVINNIVLEDAIDEALNFVRSRIYTTTS
jgi:guanylate kinase